MKIEIRATYAATDGRMPEDVVVEIDDQGAEGLTLASVVTEVMPILERLLTTASAGTFYTTAATIAPADSTYRCRRLLCRHLDTDHLEETGSSSRTACMRCQDAERCESYVGAVTNLADGRIRPVPSPDRMEMSASVLNEECRRIGCGHRRVNHLDVNHAAVDVGPYLGACYPCGGGCPGFMGADANMPGAVQS